MIESSFIILEKIGAQAERNIWKQGITSWKRFITTENIPGLSNPRKIYYDHFLEKAGTALNSSDSKFFCNCLPKSEAWRLYDFFKDDAVFLDIETTGYYGDITVVGLFDGLNTKMMIKGINLNTKELKEELSKYKLLITFNGQSFDVPVLNRYYPGIVPEIPHLDLRFACKKIGLCGGLKAIEKELGIHRPKIVEGMCGEDAVMLWHMFKATGEREYLDKLIAYNEEDIINLKKISEVTFARLKHDCMQHMGFSTINEFKSNI